MTEGWRTLCRPGYFGKKRDEVYKRFDEAHGKGNWRIAWHFAGGLRSTLERPEALQIYEDGYYEFLKSKPKVLKWLIGKASDVYDTAPSNVDARFSYDVQETPNNHIHDVAIRRAVMRLGKRFGGDHLVQVRGEGTEGEILSPHLVPFHLPQLIASDPDEDFSGKGCWWEKLGVPYSIEAFYQHNKLLQIKYTY